MPPKKFKLPNEEDPQPSKSTPTSLTNAEYCEIFEAVIKIQETSPQCLDLKSPLVGISPQVDAFSPKECASLENSQKSNSEKPIVDEPIQQEKIQKTSTELVVSSNKPKQVHSENSNQSESISTVYSEDFRKNAIFSTPEVKEPTVKKKQKSFREAVRNLKETESQLSESLLASLSQAQTSLSSSFLVDGPLSQPPAHLNHRERLLWLQARRGENVLVQCDTCDKWRLSDVQDPVDLPSFWYCYMNTDINFNNCDIPERKLSIYVEADLITNKFTAGSLVWAKVYTYPWWPAMVDDDPDTEQYYWIEDYDLNIPTSYNVTFFDGKNETVTRAWITVKNLKSFKHNLHLGSAPAKYRARIRAAKEQALEAMKYTIKERLCMFSFISRTKKRINTPIATPARSPSEDEMNDSLIIKYNQRRQCADDDPVEQLKNTFFQKSLKALKHTEENETAQLSTAVKKVTKRRNTCIVMVNDQIENEEFEIIGNVQNVEQTNAQSENKEIKNQRRRKSISGKLPQSNTSPDFVGPKKVSRRRNTRVDSSIERDRSVSQESIKEKKITKRRKTISEYPQASGEKSAVDQDSSELGKGGKAKTQRRRNSFLEKDPQRDSSKDKNEPAKVSKRRNTRVDTSIERDKSTSREPVKAKKITKRRQTIRDYEPQTSRESLKSAVDQESNELGKGAQAKTQSRRNLIAESFPQRDSSQDKSEPKKVSKRRNTRVDTSIERDRSTSQEPAKAKKITKRRQTICNYELKTSRDSPQSAVGNSISEKIPQRDSSQDKKEPKEVSKRRNTRVDTSIERDRSTSQEPATEKKITKRRQTISDYEQHTSRESLQSAVDQYTNELEKGAIAKIQRRRNTISEKNPQRDSSQETNEPPKKVTRRRNTRVDTSIERDSSYSQDSFKKEIISKSRTFIQESEMQTSSVAQRTIDDDSCKIENVREENIIQSCRSSILGKQSEKDSSQESMKPKKISSRRSTRADISIERDSSFSKDLTKENITKREVQTSRDSQNTITEEQSKLKDGNKSNTIQRRRMSIANLSENDKPANICDTNVERENSFSEGSKERSRITKRRTTISKHELQNSGGSQKTRDKDLKVSKERNTQRDSSQNSDVPEKRSKRFEYGSQNSQSTIKERNSQQKIASNSQSDKENKIRQRRNTIHETDSQKLDENQKNTKLRNIEREDSFSKDTKKKEKITKRRGTLVEYELSQNSVESQKTTRDRNSQQIEEDNSGNENKRRGSSSREKDSQRDSSLPKVTKHRTSRLDSSIEKKNTFSEELKKGMNVTKRRKTIGEHDYQLLHEGESEDTNTRKSRENKISCRRNTVERDSYFADSSISSDSGLTLNKPRSKFICPTQNTKVATAKVDNNIATEPQSELKKHRKTLGTRKIVTTNKLKTMKGTESGYESALSVKKQNLSTISEESSSNLDTSYKTDSTPKKQRRTTDEQEKHIDEKKKLKDKKVDEALEISFVSLTHSLEQLDEEKRKKKFMAICKEIVNVDKDPKDPTISPEEKVFYEKLNSSLKRVKEKQDNLSDVKLKKKVKAFEDRLEEAESKEGENAPKNKGIFKTPVICTSNTTSTVTSANTSMQSDFSDSETNATKNVNKRRSSAFAMYDFHETF